MQRRTFIKSVVAIPLAGLIHPAWSWESGKTGEAVAFGQGGSKKMLYDNRQRPQAVYLNGKVFIGFKGGGTEAGKGTNVAKTLTQLISYDPSSRQFSKPVMLGKATRDHHFCPIVWADYAGHLHVLHGCHMTPGTHLISKRPGEMGKDESDWIVGDDIAPGISYPTLFKVYGKKEVIYYRTDGHSSSWTYSISGDNGRTWTAPEKDVTDLDLVSHPEWSSYQCKVPSKDGKFLHVIFTDYDDIKSNDPKRLYNPRYRKPVGNNWKYNLSYLKINLETQEVLNEHDEVLETPVNYYTAREKCLIWDTDWRGAGVPPAVMLDENGVPAMLHVLSEDDLETHNYYYVRRENGKWKQTVVTASNHQWNSGYLRRDENGTLHAYVIVGDGYLDLPGVMNSHGGGRIEQWVSKDKGNTWSKHRDLTPDAGEYAGMRFNNVQPVLRPDGSAVDGMLLFYGWKHESEPDGEAFLLDESDRA